MDEMTSSDRNSGQIALTVLVVLAILASIVMLFTNNDAALKLALLAALWAAIIGFFLVYRYRNQAREAEAQAQLREEKHAQELETVRAQNEHSDALAELKEEIAGLRARLEEFTGQPIGYEPSAIRADARRILEVGSPSERLPGEIRVVTDTEPVSKAAQPGKTKDTSSVPESKGRHAAPPTEAGPEHPELRVVETVEPEVKGRGIPSRQERAAQHAPSDASTAEQPIVTHPERDSEPAQPVQPPRRVSGAPSADAVAGRLGQRPSGPNPLSALISENNRRGEHTPARPPADAEPSAQQRPAVSETKPKAEPKPAPAPQPEAKPEPKPHIEERPARRGRRRRDENAGSISVAELMKNMKEGR